MNLVGTQQVINNLNDYQNKMNLQFVKGMDIAMGKAENQSKKSAPWTDRTGNARNSIFGYSNPMLDDKKIVGRHGIGVEYGKYLELSNQGKYRIVWPTMDWLRGQLLEILKNG